jgi:hypothetical protein
MRAFHSRWLTTRVLLVTSVVLMVLLTYLGRRIGG